MEVKVSKDKYITRNVVWEMFLYAGQKQHQKRSTKMDGDRLRKKNPDSKWSQSKLYVKIIFYIVTQKKKSLLHLNWLTITRKNIVFLN